MFFWPVGVDFPINSYYVLCIKHTINKTQYFFYTSIVEGASKVASPSSKYLSRPSSGIFPGGDKTRGGVQSLK